MDISRVQPFNMNVILGESEKYDRQSNSSRESSYVHEETDETSFLF